MSQRISVSAPEMVISRFESKFTAVEWWATMREEGQPATLIGCSFLTFTPDGLVATGRDYWFLEPGTHAPYDGWGG